MTRLFSFKKPHLNSSFLIFFIFCTVAVSLFVNCSSPDSISSPVDSTNSNETLKLLSEAPYSIDSSNYTIQNYKLVTTDGPIYFQHIAACSTKCPVVVVSMPYSGIDWSDDPLDLAWGAKDPGGSGVLTPDVNGPDYNPASGDLISYYNSSISDAVGLGGIFLNSGISAVMVYNRFYLGRKIDQYVQDFVHVLNHLQDFNTIDTTKIALIGGSLGGFIPLHASRKSILKPQVIVGITPLLDIQNEYSFMDTPENRITANPSLLETVQHVFHSYIRRMNGMTLSQYTAEKLASENTISKILVIHDTWDTLVPIEQWQSLKTHRSIDSFIFQHATGINFNTFTIAHGQPSEGYADKSVYPIYMSYILSRLKAPSEPKIIYYFYNDFLIALIKVKEAQDRGQNISWLKNLKTDLCVENTTLKDISATIETLSGAQLVGGILLNVWNTPTTIDQGCGYLATHPTFFE